MEYDSQVASALDFSLTSRMMPISLENVKSNFQAIGTLNNDYIQLLPKVAIKYNLDSKNNLYFSISKGHRSGGYNLQMFSDIAQNGLQNSIKTDIKSGVSEKLNEYAQKGMPANIIGMINTMMEENLKTSDIDIEESTLYKPEYSWNYEIGTHLSPLHDGSLDINATLFLIECTNQQLTVFPDGMTTGRMMSNAGESRSYGGELSISYNVQRLTLGCSYGYTHATFRKYKSGDNDYSGNYLPLAPRETMAASLSYRIPVSEEFAKHFILNIGWNGTGRIYWNESNSLSQAFYSLTSASLNWEKGRFGASLWGKNIFNEEYKAFYFVSMQHPFFSLGKSRQIGVSLSLNL